MELYPLCVTISVSFFFFVTSLERHKVSVHISDLFNSQIFFRLLMNIKKKLYKNRLFSSTSIFSILNSSEKLSVHFWLT